MPAQLAQGWRWVTDVDHAGADIVLQTAGVLSAMRTGVPGKRNRPGACHASSLAVLFALSACSRQPVAPTTPIQGGPIVASVNADYVLTGNQVDFVAKDAASGETVPADWKNLTPAVADMYRSYLVARQHGEIRLVATYRGATSEVRLQSIANYGGSYPTGRRNGLPVFGQAYRLDCTLVPALGPCGNDRTGPEDFWLQLSQDKDNVKGQAMMQFGAASVTGRVDAGGRLVGLTGTFNLKGVCCDFDSWSTLLTLSGAAMSGSFQLMILGNDRQVTAIRRYELRDLPRVPQP